MIYYSNKILVPCNYAKADNDYNVLFINTVSNKEYSLDCEDTSEYDFFYEFDISNLQLENGTYQYYVNQSNNVVASGLMRVGDLKKEHTAYDNAPRYKVYEK